MKLSSTNFVSFITIFCLISSGHGFRDESCKHPSYAGYIDVRDVSTVKCTGSAATWIGNELDTLEWSAENDNEDMILEIELKAAKTITEIHTGKRTTISLVKMTYSQDGNEWDDRFLSDDKKNEEETIIFNSPLLIKYLKLMAIAVYVGSDETYMDFKIVACNECNNSVGVPKLDVDRIYIITYDKKAQAERGNIRLSDEWPPLQVHMAESSAPVIRIDLGDVYNITGMIIKGKEGEGTMDLETFSVRYSDREDFANSAYYKNENGEFQDFEGTTKEENTRYQPIYPSFLARYIFIVVKSKVDGIYFAMQIDFLGCNITRLPCNDIINTTPGKLIYSKRENKCLNDKHLEIKFVENGIYQISSVKINITGNGVPEKDWRFVQYLIIYNYDSKNEEEFHDVHRDGPIGIFRQTVTPVQSLKLCMFSEEFFDEYEELSEIAIYENITIEVRGCLIGYLPTSSSTE